MAERPPPPPPPHGSSPRPPGAMPDGNYDIFIIPPHSAGGGFLYLPSLQPHRNSFLAGVACALLAMAMYISIMPMLRSWMNTVMAGGGGIGVLFLVIGIGVAGWALGKTQGENSIPPGPGGGSTAGAGPQSQSNGYTPPPQNNQPPPPQPPPRTEPRSPPNPKGAASGWEKAKEETRRREEERKRTEDLNKKREEAQKAREEAERAAKAKAEKEKWEQARAREKDQREREARERILRERLAREKEQREKADNVRPTASARSSPSKPPTSRYEKPSARSYAGTEDEHSFRPYDKRPAYKSSASSIHSGVSEGSFAPSHGTSRTTPPPSHRGAYSTVDPDKIQIKAVYLFTDSFPLKPVASLVADTAPVTDGLVLRITSEGLFIDDDIRHVPQREWDVKAWTLKLVEDGICRGSPAAGTPSLHVLRATARDAESKKYTFVLDETEAWKVAIGLQRLRKGSQVRSLGMNGMKDAEVKGLLVSLGWI